MKQIISLLNEIALPFAYDHFAQGEAPTPPFVCYLLPISNNFSADGHVYVNISKVQIELYTDYKNILVEQKIESVLDKYNIFYEKNEIWLDSEKMYEVIYEFEKEITLATDK